MTSDNNRPLNSKSKQMVYSVSGYCLKMKTFEEAFRAPYLEKTAEVTGVIRTTVLVSDVRNLKEVALSSPTGAKREPYKYVESFDKAAIRHNTILHCEKKVADSKYS